MRILQKGFNYSQDGPGNRLVYHVQGCNFKCKWCSNPESMPLDSDKAENIDNDAIVSEIERSRMMFFDGGGITFTGGEPTLQCDDLIYILKKAQSLGVNTAIETNGSSPRLPEVSEYIDYMITDIKQPDDAIHKKYVKERFNCCTFDVAELTEELKCKVSHLSIFDRVDYKTMRDYIKQIKIYPNGEIATIFINNAEITYGGA